MTGKTASLEDLRALTEAGVALTSELSLQAVLQKVVEVARQQIGARYAALSVLGADGRIAQFITDGISPEERELIGSPPTGRGLLGVLLHQGESLRLDDMSKDPRSSGFPPHHPPMTSLLGLPLTYGKRIIGNLYLADKIGAPGFDDRDEEILRLLATQAAVAIRNAELYEKSESLARLEERERIGMDLHDGVMQSIYAVGLNLEDCIERLKSSPEEAEEGIERAINSLNNVIKDIRSYIFDLRPKVSVVADLPDAIRQLVDDVRVNTLMKTNFDVEGGVKGLITQNQAVALFHIAQEALNNVSKHSGADSVTVRLQADEHAVTVEVTDNGKGMDLSQGPGHERHGLRNMRDRARSVGADLFIESEPGKGTTVRAVLPVQTLEENDE